MKARFFLILMFIIPLGTVCSLHAQNNIAESQWVGNNTPIKVTSFNNAKEGQYNLTLNLFTNTYNTRAKMNAVVDLNTNSIQVTEYSHFASKNKNDAIIGSGSSEVTTKSDAYCKFKLYLSNNTLYLEQIMNPGGPAGKLRLNPSSWEKMKNQGDIAQSQWVGNNTPIKVTTFNNAKEGQYALSLNLFTNTYNTRAKMNAVVDLNTNAIQVTEYSHFASKNKNDAVIGSGSSEVTTKSDAYCKFKLYLSNNTLYLEQIMNPGGPAGKLRLNPSSWKKESLSSNNSPKLDLPRNSDDVSIGEYTVSKNKLAEKTDAREIPNTKSNEGDYVCVTEKVNAARSFDVNFVVENASERVIYPGAMVYAEDMLSGRYTTINANRTPITLSTDLPITNGEPKVIVNKPESLADVRVGVNKLLNQQSRGVLHSTASYDFKQVYSEQQLDIALGGRFKRSGLTVQGTFGMSMSESKNYIVAKFLQKYFTVNVDQMNSTSDFFVNQNEAYQVMSNDKTPLYISSVDYGRAAYFMLETSENQLSVEATLDVLFEGKSIDVEANLETKFNKLMKSSTMKVLVIGGRGKVAVKSITGYDGFKEMITTGGELGRNEMPRPIAYTMSFIEDGSVANVNLTTNYTKRNCKKVSDTYKVKVHHIVCTNVSGDEQADDGANDQNEVWGAIQVFAETPDGIIPFEGILETLTDMAKSKIFGWRELLKGQVSIGSEDNQIYLEEDISGMNPNNIYPINKEFIFKIPVSESGSPNVDFKIEASLTEHDTWSKNDEFKNSVTIPYSKANISEFNPEYLELRNGSDKIRVYYSIEPQS